MGVGLSNCKGITKTVGNPPRNAGNVKKACQCVISQRTLPHLSIPTYAGLPHVAITLDLSSLEASHNVLKNVQRLSYLKVLCCSSRVSTPLYGGLLVDRLADSSSPTAMIFSIPVFPLHPRIVPGASPRCKRY